MHKLQALGIVLLAVWQPIYGQVPFFGPCPDVFPMKNFNAELYLGKWYEAERYFAIFEFGGKCVTANYSPNDQGDVRVINRQISAITGLDSEIEGVATATERGDEGKLTVAFPSVPSSPAAPYWILDTDYETYSVVWSCSSFGLFSTMNAWILTREPFPKLETIEKAYKVLYLQQISRSYFIKTDQTNCPTNT